MTTPEVLSVCVGFNRFGAPCTNRVREPDTTCGKCGATKPAAAPADAGAPAVPEPVTGAVAAPVSILASPPADEAWTPAAAIRKRLEAVAGGDPELLRLVEVCARLAANTKAASSKAAYQQHWSTFEKFGTSIGTPITVPVAPELVCLFIAFLTHYRRVDPATGARDETTTPLSHSYLVQAVAAIGYRHLVDGHPDPTSDPAVRSLLDGYAKTYGTNRDPKDPIGLDQLGTICLTLNQPSPTAGRDLAIVLLATDPDLDLGPAQIAGISPNHVLPPATPLEPMYLLVGTRGTANLRPVEVWPNRIAAICPIRALTALLDNADPTAASIFATGGRAVSREGVAWIAALATRRAGITPTVVDRRLPRLTAADRVAVAAVLDQPSDTAQRDRAAIANLYWGCFRGHELAATRFHQLRFVDQGIEWHTPRTKNDQTGRGHTRGIPANTDPWVCPVTAMNDWLARLELLHARPLRGDDPVFPTLNRPGTHNIPMSRDTVNSIVKNAASRAGLTGNFGSHSPRTGFVTNAIDAGRPREQIQTYGNWGAAKSLDPYYRRTAIWSTTNPAQHLTNWNT